MPCTIQPRIIFITGTDTGVGKTFLTSLLLSHLRQTGSRALAIKPFCSGGRADAELLHDLQDGDLNLGEINPFYFSEPIAPLVAARKHNRRISLKLVLAHIQSVAMCSALQEFKVRGSKFKVQGSVCSSPRAAQPSTLLIEGSGGLLAPLGEGFNLLDLLLALTQRTVSKSSIQHPASSISVVIVAPNRLGTLNHTLLTIQALHTRDIRKIKVVLMDLDLSLSRITHHVSRTNPSILAELLSPLPLFCIPNLGKNLGKSEQIHKSAKKLKKTLAQILA